MFIQKIPTIMEAANLSLSDEDVKSMLMEKTSKGTNIFALVVDQGNTELVAQLIAVLKNQALTPDEFDIILFENKNGNHWLYNALRLKKLKYINFLFEIIRNRTTAGKYKQFLKRRVGILGNILYFPYLNKNPEKILSRLIKEASHFLSKDEIKSLLMQKDADGFNTVASMIRFRSEIKLTELFKVLRSFLNSQDVCELIMSIDNNGENWFHRTVRLTEPAFLLKLLPILMKFLSPEKQKKLFSMIDKENRNILHQAHQNKLRDKIFWIIFDIICKLFSKEDVNQMLYQKDNSETSMIAFLA
jgi:hypothetical protein